MMNRFSLKRYLKAETGVAAIEMAFIMPMMLLLYFGLVDLTGMISFNRKITSVANATADLVGQNRTNVLKTDMVDYFKVSGLIMNPTPDSEVKIRIFGYRLVGSTITRMWVVDNGKGSSCSSDPSTVGMADLMEAGNDLVVAQTCMKYTPYVGTFLGKDILGDTNFDVEETVTLRPRSSLTLNCYLSSTGGTPCPTS